MNDEIKKYIDDQLNKIRELCNICNKCKITKLTFPPPVTCNIRPPYCSNCDINKNIISNKNILNNKKCFLKKINKSRFCQ